MYFKITATLVCLASVLTFSECTCPDDVILGELHFLNTDLLPFEGDENFTFVNSQGEELLFDSVGMGVTQSSIVMDIPCSHPELNAQAIHYVTDFIDFHYHLKRSVSIGYGYSIWNDIPNPVNNTDTAFYEIFGASLFNRETEEISATNDFFTLVSSTRGNTLQPATEQINESVRIISDTTINGYSYSNVYCPKERPGIFYSAEFGIVLFHYKNDWWNLKR